MMGLLGRERSLTRIIIFSRLNTIAATWQTDGQTDRHRATALTHSVRRAVINHRIRACWIAINRANVVRLQRVLRKERWIRKVEYRRGFFVVSSSAPVCCWAYRHAVRCPSTSTERNVQRSQVCLLYAAPPFSEPDYAMGDVRPSSWAPTGMGKGGTCPPLEKLKSVIAPKKTPSMKSVWTATTALLFSEKRPRMIVQRRLFLRSSTGCQSGSTYSTRWRCWCTSA